MSTILEAVGAYLAANGQGTLGTDLFLGKMPDTPDVLRCIHESSGAAADLTMGSAAFAVDRPSLQVVCRAGREDYPVARDMAVATRNLLAAVVSTTMSGLSVLRIEASGSILPMGEDENGRPTVSVNFDCWVLP